MCQIPCRIIVDHVIRRVIARPAVTKTVNTTPWTEGGEVAEVVLKNRKLIALRKEMDVTKNPSKFMQDFLVFSVYFTTLYQSVRTVHK